MTINTGVTVKNTGSYSSMIENGYFSYYDLNHRNGYVSGTNRENPVLTINGGEFVVGLNSVKNDDGGILNITDGNFSNTTQAAVLNWNEATISGGTFTVTAENCNAVLNGAYSSSSSENDKGKLTITGASFISTGDPVENYFTGVTKPAVSGGNFSASVDEDFLTDDIKAELYSAKNPEAPYSYYKSLEAAQQVAEPGDIVTDLSNVEDGAEKVTVVINDGIGSVTTAEVNSGSNIILPFFPRRLIVRVICLVVGVMTAATSTSPAMKSKSPATPHLPLSGAVYPPSPAPTASP